MPHSQLRVLFVNSSKAFSGAEISLRLLIESLPSDRFVCFLLVPSVSPLVATANTGVRTCTTLSFDRTVNPLKMARQFASILHVASQICSISRREKIDIVYYNGFNSFICGLPVSRFIKARRFLHVRDRVKMPKRLQRYFLRNLSIITPSQFIATQFHSKLKLSIVPNGTKSVDTELPPHERHDFIVGGVFQFTRWKNIEDFIEVISILHHRDRSIKFKIAGHFLSQGDAAYHEQMLKRLAPYVSVGVVELTGFVDDIHTVYSNIDVLLHTALNEPFGRVIIEAMSFAVPVVAYHSGGIAEIVVDGETGFLVKPREYGDLAEKILKLRRSPVQCRLMGDQARAIVNSKFSLASHVENVVTQLTSPK